jgi:hypothetical protein
VLWCRQGVNAYAGAFSPPNAITFIGCTVGLNAEYGMLIEHCDTFTFTGGSIESNGLSADGGYGIQLYQPGDNGAVAANFLGVHFENNPSVADILVNAGPQPFAVNAIGCSFSRNDPAKFSINNIQVNTSEGSRVYLNVIGCGFRGFNGYVPSAERPFIQMPDDGTVRLTDLGTVYDNDLEKPAASQAS